MVGIGEGVHNICGNMATYPSEFRCDLLVNDFGRDFDHLLRAL